MFPNLRFEDQDSEAARLIPVCKGSQAVRIERTLVSVGH